MNLVSMARLYHSWKPLYATLARVKRESTLTLY